MSEGTIVTSDADYRVNMGATIMHHTGCLYLNTSLPMPLCSSQRTRSFS